MTRPREPSTPPIIPGFTFVKVLGMGGFADVFEYLDDSLKRSVAVKVLLRNNSGVQASFGPEGHLMAKLSNHPFIVSVHRDGVADDGRPYLVMEYCPPPHLSWRIRRKPLPVQQALTFTVQIASAVATSHRLGILHRDIKPANILFTEYGYPALTDFGISLPTSADGTATGAGMSVGWAPPEQLVRGGVMRPSSDVYSLAATLHHMLTGRSPFSGGGADSILEHIKRVTSDPVPRVRRDDVPESLQRVLTTAMAKDPRERYGTALEFARALNAVQMELHQAPTPIEVRSDIDPGLLESDEDEDAGGTRIESIVLIDPDAGPSKGPRGGDRRSGQRSDRAVDRPDLIHHGQGFAGAIDPIEWTGDTQFEPDGDTAGDPIEAPGAAPASATAAVTGGRRSAWRWAVSAAVATAAAAAVAFLVLGGSGGGTEGPAARPRLPSAGDPIGSPVPLPAEATGATQDGQVTFSWTNPDPAPGDTFFYRVDSPGTEANLIAADGLQATVPEQPGRTCIEVILRRSTGKASDPAAMCVPEQNAAPAAGSS